MNKNKLLILMTMSIPVITTGVISAIDTNAVDTAIETYATSSINNYRVENVTDEGFDFIIKFNSDIEVTSLHLPYWKQGNYNGMTNNDSAVQRIAYNEFKLHIKMSDIGSGTEYVYIGIHPRFADGSSAFIRDIAIKLDTTTPNLTLTPSNTNWTNQNITVKSVSNDNQNIIENLYYYNKDNTVSKYSMYSTPKILVIKGYDSSGIAEKYNGRSNVTIVSASTITSVSQLTPYDVVIYDGRYWGVSTTELGTILNNAFEQGVSLITNLNDSPGNLSIATGSTGGYGGAYTFNNYNNDKGSYSNGRLNRFAYLIEGKTESDSGYHTTSAGTGAFIISNRTYDDGKTSSPGILMRTHSNGNKWIHAQSSDIFQMYALDRAVDEIMSGTMKTRQGYEKSFTISENGTYSVEVEDFSGNKTKKSIAVSNIDKVLPTINISGNPTSWSQSATLTITGADDLSGVKEIVLPNGTIVSGSTTNYTVGTNGSYTFKIRDKAGNEISQTISVTNIDNTINSLTGVRQSMNVIDTTTSTRRMTFIFNPVADTGSGLKGYSYVIDNNPSTEPDNNINATVTTITKDITDTGVYYLHIKAIDNAGNISNVVHKKVDIANLTSTVNTTNNMIRLDWTMNDISNKTFKVYQKKPGSNEFQSIGATNFNITNKQVKVLNVYPPTAKNETYTTWKGETITLPISASLKKWMEMPNSEDSKGYGKGIINVDVVVMDDFNANPDAYLKDSSGNYKYDVVMFGSMDSNGGKDLTTLSLEATKQFIDSGKGVLFGHDTVTQWNGRVNFPKLQDYINVKTYGFTGVPSTNVTPDMIWTMPWSGGEEISVNKKGFLTNYPWEVCDIGTKLTVPYTHTNSQVAKGDVWMKFSNPKADTQFNVPIDTTEHSDNGVGTNMAYLTSWNNTAMIQTGHSIGRFDTTADEQKLLANTLFYLNQLSSDNYLDDYSGQDVDAPTKPTLNNLDFSNNGSITFNLNPSTDNGSTYEYYVESQSKDNDNTTQSNNTKTTITSGLKGYSYVIDSNPSTEPDNVVDSPSATITSNITSNNMYLHVKAVDNVGNGSETIHYQVSDIINPTINITGNPTSWTNQNVTLNVTGSDVGYGVKHIVLPNGNIVTGSTTSYTVSDNGNYTFKVVDKMGNETSQTIAVNKIDKSISSLNNINQSMTIVNTTNSTRKMTFTFNPIIDTGSGLKGYSYVIDQNPSTVPDNNVNSTVTTITKDITDTGVYYLHIKAIDNAGNISNVVHKKVDIANLTSTVNTTDNMIRLDWNMNDLNNKTFKVYQKKPGNNEFQSISATNFDTTNQVKVLNIHPNMGTTETFSTWDGENLTLQKSASLKKWLEEPNSENPKGYGKGLIEVTPVTIEDFNSSPNDYLRQDSSGNWNYDVVVIGSYDSNGRKDIANNSMPIITNFINNGGGILFGHDTIANLAEMPNLRSLSSYLNMKSSGGAYFNGINEQGGVATGNSKITVTKKGSLINYPWIVGDIGTDLIVPSTHTSGQVANGDIWMRFNYENTNMNNSANYYLTTWNNTAMIQTGHSNGSATPDEQKLLANTLFYLNQLSTDNFLDDYSGQDIIAPNKPVIYGHNFTEDGLINLNFNAVTDNGSEYSYYIESQTRDNDSLTLSNVVTETITSGMRGYSYIVDSNPTTVPDDTIEQSTNETIKIKTNNNSELYVHIKAIDNVGNGSETYHYRITDVTKPTITITKSPSTWTNGTVTLTATATDSGSGVKYMILPNGNKVSASSVSYVVDKNGIYYFRTIDYMGNEATVSVIVDNIDKKIPTVTITNNQNWTNQDVQVNITATDD